MAASRWTAVLLVLFVARAAGAASLGVAWDPSTEPGVTGYRVFVATTPGQPAASFDVGPYQTTYLYTSAIGGQRYFFSVATRVGEIVGPPSSEVSGIAAPAAPVAPPPPTRQPPSPPLPPPLPPLDGWYEGASGRAILDDALGPVSSLVVDSGGTGLFIEGGASIRLLVDGAIAGAPVLEAEPQERFLSIALDPAFAVNGHVFVLSEITLSGAAQELTIARHRLLRGELGERATVRSVPALGSEAHVALSPAGHVFVGQPGQVLRFAADGTVPRDQPSGTPLWAALAGRPKAMLWDPARQGLWVATESPTEVAALLLRDGVPPSAVALPPSGRDEVEEVGLSSTLGRVHAYIVSAGGVTLTDLENGASEAVTLPPLGRTLVGWTPISSGAYVVVDSTMPERRGVAHRVLLLAGPGSAR